ncbi:unnamed protein product [Protopolystoma xenopodis]|uniref:Uncharacterized protein n=1 Tax=Protopolystoma xenopodis TaxID=117903 RepID=A0A3S5BQJ8_9PLAT|nr:unnamed protein product [Protopolystoma xenopodis]
MHHHFQSRTVDVVHSQTFYRHRSRRSFFGDFFVNNGFGSDDVRHMTDERSARSHKGRWTVSRSLLRTIRQTKFQGNPPSASDEANLQIPSARVPKRNERYTVSIYSRIFRNPASLHINITAWLSEIWLAKIFQLPS